MANCLSPCPTDLVIEAGPFHAVGTGNDFLSHTFFWPIPAGLAIGSVRYNVEWRVDAGPATARYAAFPINYLFVNEPIGIYTSTFNTPPLISGPVVPGTTISTTLQFFGDGVNPFNATIDCFSLVISPICQKPLISIGTGDSVTVCTSGETRIANGFGLLPKWVRDGDKKWVIFDDQGNLINTSLTPLAYPRYIPHLAPPCNYATIEIACSPFSYAHSPQGSYVTGPLHAEYLTDLHLDPINGWEYTVLTCSPFDVVVDHKCAGVKEPPPPSEGGPASGAHAAIEQDGPRRWIHVGIGKTIQSYDQDYTKIFSGDYPVDAWHKFCCDPRLGTLAALGRKDTTDSAGAVTGSTFSVWVSTDGGQTGNKAGEMAASSSLLERDSERGWILWFTADGSNNVSLQVSKDGGVTYDTAVDVNLDDGTRLQGVIMDSCQDCRSGGRVAMVVSPGKDPAAAPTSTVIVVSDDGGKTFRKVA